MTTAEMRAHWMGSMMGDMMAGCSDAAMVSPMDNSWVHQTVRLKGVLKAGLWDTMMAAYLAELTALQSAGQWVHPKEHS